MKKTVPPLTPSPFTASFFFLLIHFMSLASLVSFMPLYSFLNEIDRRKTQLNLDKAPPRG